MTVHQAGDLLDAVQQGMADQDVVDELSPAAVNPGVTLVSWQERGQVPQPPGITLVRPVGTGDSELRACRAEQDLGGGRFGYVVEVTGDDDGSVLPLSVNERVDMTHLME